MALSEVHLFVTDHALERWRQRASAYADETKEDVLLALLESDKGRPPFLVKGGSRYFLHPASGTWLACDASQPGRLAVVTCVNADSANGSCLNAPVLTLKPKKKALKWQKPPAPHDLAGWRMALLKEKKDLEDKRSALPPHLKNGNVAGDMKRRLAVVNAVLQEMEPVWKAHELEREREFLSAMLEVTA